MLPFSARMVTFLVSIIAAAFTSLLLTVIRLLICLHGATVSRKDVVSSTDFLPRDDGVAPLLHDFRLPWRFGGTRFNVSLVSIVMLYCDAYAVSRVDGNASCAYGKYEKVESDIDPACMFLEADPEGNGDAQVGLAMSIMDPQRALGFSIKGVPGKDSTDAELQVYYREDCGFDAQPEAREPTIALSVASDCESKDVTVLFVLRNTTLS